MSLFDPCQPCCSGCAPCSACSAYPLEYSYVGTGFGGNCSDFNQTGLVLKQVGDNCHWQGSFSSPGGPVNCDNIKTMTATITSIEPNFNYPYVGQSISLSKGLAPDGTTSWFGCFTCGDGTFSRICIAVNCPQTLDICGSLQLALSLPGNSSVYPPKAIRTPTSCTANPLKAVFSDLSFSSNPSEQYCCYCCTNGICLFGNMTITITGTLGGGTGPGQTGTVDLIYDTGKDTWVVTLSDSNNNTVKYILENGLASWACCGQNALQFAGGNCSTFPSQIGINALDCSCGKVGAKATKRTCPACNACSGGWYFHPNYVIGYNTYPDYWTLNADGFQDLGDCQYSVFNGSWVLQGSGMSGPQANREGDCSEHLNQRYDDYSNLHDCSYKAETPGNAGVIELFNDTVDGFQLQFSLNKQGCQTANYITFNPANDQGVRQFDCCKPNVMANQTGNLLNIPNELLIEPSRCICPSGTCPDEGGLGGQKSAFDCNQKTTRCSKCHFYPALWRVDISGFGNGVCDCAKFNGSWFMPKNNGPGPDCLYTYAIDDNHVIELFYDYESGAMLLWLGCQVDQLTYTLGYFVTFDAFDCCGRNLFALYSNPGCCGNGVEENAFDTPCNPPDQTRYDIFTQIAKNTIQSTPPGTGVPCLYTWCSDATCCVNTISEPNCTDQAVCLGYQMCDSQICTSDQAFVVQLQLQDNWSNGTTCLGNGVPRFIPIEPAVNCQCSWPICQDSRLGNAYCKCSACAQPGGGFTNPNCTCRVQMYEVEWPAGQVGNGSCKSCADAIGNYCICYFALDPLSSLHGHTMYLFEDGTNVNLVVYIVDGTKCSSFNPPTAGIVCTTLLYQIPENSFNCTGDNVFTFTSQDPPDGCIAPATLLVKKTSGSPLCNCNGCSLSDCVPTTLTLSLSGGVGVPDFTLTLRWNGNGWINMFTPAECVNMTFLVQCTGPNSAGCANNSMQLVIIDNAPPFANSSACSVLFNCNPFMATFNNVTIDGGTGCNGSWSSVSLTL